MNDFPSLHSPGCAGTSFSVSETSTDTTFISGAFFFLLCLFPDDIVYRKISLKLRHNYYKQPKHIQ